MKNSIEIHIPKPCHAPADDFSPSANGRFCRSCQKEVIDFKAMSDAEMLAFFKNAQGKSLCGSFRKDQLERPLAVPQTGNRHWIVASLGALLALGAAPALANVHAHGVGQYQQQQQKPNEASGDSTTVLVKGYVVYEEDGSPVSGAIVLLKGSVIHAITDINGYFELLLPREEKITLVISYVGVLREERTIESSETIFDFGKIPLKIDPNSLDGSFTVIDVNQPRKGFFHRVKRVFSKH